MSDFRSYGELEYMFDAYDLNEIYQKNPDEYNNLMIYLCGRPTAIFDENCPTFVESGLIHKFRNSIDIDFKEENNDNNSN